MPHADQRERDGDVGVPADLGLAAVHTSAGLPVGRVLVVLPALARRRARPIWCRGASKPRT